MLRLKRSERGLSRRISVDGGGGEVVGIQIEESVLAVEVEHPSFEEWWEPFMLGVGPAGGYVTRLDSKRQTLLRDLCRTMLPEAPFVVSARAWAARGLA